MENTKYTNVSNTRPGAVFRSAVSDPATDVGKYKAMALLHILRCGLTVEVPVPSFCRNDSEYSVKQFCSLFCRNDSEYSVQQYFR